MKFGKYLKDRLYSVIIYIFVIIAVILLMTAFKSQIELKITVGIIITLLWISEIFIDFFRKKRYFDEFVNNTQNLEQKYLVMEMLSEPSFYEGKIIYDVISDIDKSMVENVKKYCHATQDFKEYVEMWIHEIKLPIASMTLILHNYKEKYPDVQSIDKLQSEYEKRDFVLAFREIIKKRAEMQIYEDFESDDKEFILSEQEFMDFRSKYLDITTGVINPNPDDKKNTGDTDVPPYGKDERTLDDIDFCLELLHSDVINVAYILTLINDLDPSSNDYQERRQQILDTMIKDAVMRNKAKLIDGFIRQNVDNDKDGFSKSKSDGSIDLESRLTNYVSQQRYKAIQELAEEEGIDEEALIKFLNEYDFLQKEKPEILQEAVKKKRIGLKERRTLLKRIMDKLHSIIELFNWE